VDARYANFNPAMENGVEGSERRYYEPADFKEMNIQHVKYNDDEKRWAKATDNNFSYIKAQGADFTECNWNQANASHSDFSTHDPNPPDAVKKLEGYDQRKFDLTGSPVWKTRSLNLMEASGVMWMPSLVTLVGQG
jgi:uncharacterized protein YjbI with pentapeptide repeats